VRQFRSSRFGPHAKVDEPDDLDEDQEPHAHRGRALLAAVDADLLPPAATAFPVALAFLCCSAVWRLTSAVNWSTPLVGAVDLIADPGELMRVPEVSGPVPAACEALRWGSRAEDVHWAAEA
jgi:hypothetical protein